jgi:hypothetical protein
MDRWQLIPCANTTVCILTGLTLSFQSVTENSPVLPISGKNSVSHEWHMIYQSVLCWTLSFGYLAVLIIISIVAIACFNPQTIPVTARYITRRKISP